MQRAFGARERLDVKAVQPSREQPNGAVRRSHVDQRPPVGRDIEQRRVVSDVGRLGVQSQGRIPRQIDLGAQPRTTRDDRGRRTHPARANDTEGHADREHRRQRDDSAAAESEGLCSNRRLAGLSHRVPQLESHVAEIASAVLWILLQTALHDAHDGTRSHGHHRVPIRLSFDDSRNRLGDVVAGECASANQHLVHDTTERPHIGAPVHHFAARLLRTHVGGGAHDDADARRRRAGEGR